MNVEIKLYASMKEFMPGGGDYSSCKFELEEGATVGTALDKLGIPVDMPKVVLINGIAAKPEKPLNEGDILSIFPPMAGG